MKKYKLKITSLVLVFLTILSCTAFATLNDNKDLSWYFVNRQNNSTPEAPKESAEYINELNSFYVGNTTEKELYLTFDEGYEKGNTEEILNILKEVNVKAAFFVVKPYITSHPEIIKRMVNEGHLVCNHSVNHKAMSTIKDTNEFTKEFTDVEAAYKELTGKDMPKYFRPPMGRYSKESLIRTNNLGYKTIFWSFAYKDWLVDNQPASDYAVNKIIKGMHPGCIILLHAVSDTNTKILKDVLNKLQQDGYVFKTLDELPEKMILSNKDK